MIHSKNINNQIKMNLVNILKVKNKQFSKLTKKKKTILPT